MSDVTPSFQRTSDTVEDISLAASSMSLESSNLQFADDKQDNKRLETDAESIITTTCQEVLNAKLELTRKFIIRIWLHHNGFAPNPYSQFQDIFAMAATKGKSFSSSRPKSISSSRPLIQEASYHEG